MKLTKTKLKQIVQEELEEGLGDAYVNWMDKNFPGEPGEDEPVAVQDVTHRSPFQAMHLEKGIKALLEKWPDKKHPYFIDLMNLYQQSGGE